VYARLRFNFNSERKSCGDIKLGFDDMLEVIRLLQTLAKQNSVPSSYSNAIDRVAGNFFKERSLMFSIILALVSRLRAIKVKSQEWNRKSKEALFFKAVTRSDRIRDRAIWQLRLNDVAVVMAADIKLQPPKKVYYKIQNEFFCLTSSARPK